MKKGLIFLCSLLMIFCASYDVNADVIWEGPYNQFQYRISDNGGWFMNISTHYFDMSHHDRETFQDTYNGLNFSEDFSKQANGNLTELDGAVVLKAMAQGPDGGINPSNGTLVKGYTEATFSNFNSSLVFNGSQKITAFVVRRLHVDTPGDYIFNGYFTGSINFNSIGSIDSPFFTLYSVYGTVRLEELAAMDGGYITSLGAWDINLDEAIRSDTIQLGLRPSVNIDGVDRDVYYQLSTVLHIEANFQNYVGGPTNSGNFEGVYQLGNEIEPLEVGGNISPVPIPGSVLMLLSGLGGLIMVARRR